MNIAQRKWLPISILVTGLVASAVAATVIFRAPDPLPKSATSQLTFAALVPISEDIEIAKTSVVVSKPQGQEDAVLNYTAKVSGIDILVGQQPTPQQFTDIPQTYDKVVEQSKLYDSFESVEGTVYLTRPKSKQIAMLNTKGTYMLAQATEDLSKEQWRKFFKNIQIVD